MNYLLYQTNVEEAAHMLTMDDGKIREYSKGEVTDSLDYDDMKKTKGTQLDRDIFGGMDSLNMGHIELPVPVVNIHYLYGDKPILSKLLKMSADELERIIYRAKYVDTDKNSAEYKKTYTTNPEKSIGAEAVEELLDAEGIDKKNIILRTVPVVPLNCRYGEGEKGEIWSKDLSYLYERLLNRCERFTRLQDLNAPFIIISNEIRMLQEAVDALISNGLRGRAVTNRYGAPCRSLYELYHSICDFEPASVEPEVDFDISLIDPVRNKIMDIRYAGNEEAFVPEEYYTEYAKVVKPLAEEVFDKYFSRYRDFREETLEDTLYFTPACPQDVPWVFSQRIMFYVTKKARKIS